EHRDEMHGPDARRADGDRRQHQPAGACGACECPGPGHAAQPEEGAQTGHRVTESRIHQPVREIVDGNSPHVTPQPRCALAPRIALFTRARRTFYDPDPTVTPRI